MINWLHILMQHHNWQLSVGPFHAYALRWVLSNFLLLHLLVTAGVNFEYDVIIIGSGSSGSVLTGRYTRAGKKVLLIEAGRDPQPCNEVNCPITSWFRRISNFRANKNGHLTKLQVPKISFTCMMKSFQDWTYFSTDNNTCNAQLPDDKGRRCYIPRAKAIGGCASMNLMFAIIYWYGIYDLWVQYFGCDGWGFTDIIQYFIKMEHYNQRYNDTTVLGYNGPMNIMPFYPDPNVPFLNRSYNENEEYQWVDNINKGGVFGGFTLVDSTTKDCRRFSSSKAYIIPVKNSPNLTILQNCLAVKILFDQTNTIAIGVQFLYNGKLYEVYVKSGGRVISCAGVFGTPILLMLSGIGDATYLQQKGITCIQNLPVLRKYLWDHFGCWIWVSLFYFYFAKLSWIFWLEIWFIFISYL